MKFRQKIQTKLDSVKSEYSKLRHYGTGQANQLTGIIVGLEWVLQQIDK